MKKTRNLFLVIVLSLTTFAYPVIADCGEQGHGSKCLVQSPPVTNGETKKDIKKPSELEKQIPWFFRGLFKSIFG